MLLSIFVPLALLTSISIGFGMVAFAIWSVLSRNDRSRWRIATAAILGALTVNSWWIAFFGLVFYKFFILREDT